MEKLSVFLSNTILSGLIPPKPLNEFLKSVQEHRLDIWSFQGHPKVYQEPLVATMMMGKVNELKIFLKYGFEKTVSKMLQIITSLEYISKAISKDNRLGDILISLSDIKHFLRNVDERTEKRRRLIIETFAVASCLHLSHEFSHPISMCYEMAWMTTPEPYVKYHEMFRVMVLLCGSRADEGIRSVCETFREKFGKVTEGPQKPRRLKHLCRCSIRRALTKTFQLPHSIDMLNLPESLKAYLRLTF